jgi:hypothetical protein
VIIIPVMECNVSLCWLLLPGIGSFLMHQQQGCKGRQFLYQQGKVEKFLYQQEKVTVEKDNLLRGAACELWKC